MGSVGGLVLKPGEEEEVWDLTPPFSCAGSPRGLLQPASLPGEGPQQEELMTWRGVGGGRVRIVKFRER